MFFLGVDAGGTKTRVVASNDSGKVIGYGLGGPGNHLSGSLDLLKNSILEALAYLRLSEEKFESICFGFSGLGINSYSEKLGNLIRECVSTKNVVMNNDCVVALYGAFTGGSGVAAIAGTGSVILGMDRDGNIFRLGGWGHILGDEGSSYKISIDAIKVALRSQDWSESTGLFDRVMRFFNFKDPKDIIRFFYLENHLKHEIAAFAPEVFKEAQNGDPLAQTVVKNNARDLARTANSFLKKHRNIENRLVTIGGVFKNELFLNFFKDALDCDFKIAEPELSPVFGALLLAAKGLAKENFGKMIKIESKKISPLIY